MSRFERTIILAGAVIAVILQVFLAPHIGIGYGVPNFLIVFCIVVAIMNPRYYNCILPFVLGLIYDFTSGGPVGAMAFTLTAITMGCAWFYECANNDTPFMAVINLAVGVLLIEVCYGIFLLIFGYGTNPFDSFLYRTLPCFLYDLVLAVILYFVASRFFKEETTSQPMIKRVP